MLLAACGGGDDPAIQHVFRGDPQCVDLTDAHGARPEMLWKCNKMGRR